MAKKPSDSKTNSQNSESFLSDLNSLLETNDTKIQKVPLPEWNGHVFIRSAGGDDREALDNFIREHGDSSGRVSPKRLRAKCLSLCVSNEAGKCVWTFEDAAKVVEKKSAKPVERLFDAACKSLGISQTDLEDMEKN